MQTECVAASGGFYAITSTPGVQVADNAPNYGQVLTLTATVTGTASATPSGSVTWQIQGSSGSVPCTSTTGPTGTTPVATYTCSISAGTYGTYKATATFEGDANYAPASGTDQVTVTGGPPSITKIAPTSGAPGATVKIKGMFLDGAVKVTIGGQEAPMVSDSSTLLEIRIPKGATTGRIKVKTMYGTTKSAGAFKVT